MSPYTTLRVSRSAARKYLLNRILGATDDQLESMLDEFLPEGLHNAIIVDDDRANDDVMIGGTP